MLQCPEADPFSSPLCAPLPGSCKAVVADIDFDGRADVVATGPQEPGLIVLRSDPKGGLHLSILQTQCPPHNLVPGDFDDDGVTDIAFFDQAAPRSGEPVTTLKIAYGNALAHPSPPEGDARFVGALALAAVHFSDAPDEQLASVGMAGIDAKSGRLTLIGSENNRALLAPFYLTGKPPGGMGPSMTLPLFAAAAGQFAPKDGANPRTWRAVITPGEPMQPERLWLLEADESGSNLRAGRQSAIELPACSRCVLAAFDADGDGGDEIMVLGKSDIAVLGSDTGTFGEGAFAERARFSVGESFATIKKT